MITENHLDKKKSRGVRPTRRQKQLISQHRLTPANWLVLSVTPAQLQLQHKKNGTTRVINCL
uniref:DUF6906 family protein n=1 Tax=Paenibacillus sp. FSL H7-0350 TaxID=2975345 RepID=UPI00406D3B21